MKTTHILYETCDQDAPRQIKDRNGEVCLGMCKVCGAGETELTDYPTCAGYAQGKMTNWQKHTGTDHPAGLAPSQIMWLLGPTGKRMTIIKVSHIEPRKLGSPCLIPALDHDGVPYCSPEGLERWTEYVCWDNIEGGKQAGNRVQFKNGSSWQPETGCTFLVELPETHHKPGDPADSLMRVWREK